MDGNEIALNRYLKQEELKDNMALDFDNAIDEDMKQIIESIYNILKTAEWYEQEYGFDFIEYAEENIKDTIHSII